MTVATSAGTWHLTRHSRRDGEQIQTFNTRAELQDQLNAMGIPGRAWHQGGLGVDGFHRFHGETTTWRFIPEPVEDDEPAPLWWDDASYAAYQADCGGDGRPEWTGADIASPDFCDGDHLIEVPF